MKAPNNQLDILLGEKVSGICFVMDYLEIHFNGPILRCLTEPVLDTGTIQFKFPAMGSRDAFCSLIDDEVAMIELKEEKYLKLRFKSNRTVLVPLDQKSRKGAEALHFVPEVNKPIQIW